MFTFSRPVQVKNLDHRLAPQDLITVTRFSPVPASPALPLTERAVGGRPSADALPGKPPETLSSLVLTLPRAPPGGKAQLCVGHRYRFPPSYRVKGRGHCPGRAGPRVDKGLAGPHRHGRPEAAVPPQQEAASWARHLPSRPHRRSRTSTPPRRRGRSDRRWGGPPSARDGRWGTRVPGPRQLPGSASEFSRGRAAGSRARRPLPRTTHRARPDTGERARYEAPRAGRAPLSPLPDGFNRRPVLPLPRPWPRHGWLLAGGALRPAWLTEAPALPRRLGSGLGWARHSTAGRRAWLLAPRPTARRHRRLPSKLQRGSPVWRGRGRSALRRAFPAPETHSSPLPSSPGGGGAEHRGGAGKEGKGFPCSRGGSSFACPPPPFVATASALFGGVLLAPRLPISLAPQPQCASAGQAAGWGLPRRWQFSPRSKGCSTLALLFQGCSFPCSPRCLVLPGSPQPCPRGRDTRGGRGVAGDRGGARRLAGNCFQKRWKSEWWVSLAWRWWTV